MIQAETAATDDEHSVVDAPWIAAPDVEFIAAARNYQVVPRRRDPNRRLFLQLGTLLRRPGYGAEVFNDAPAIRWK